MKTTKESERPIWGRNISRRREEKGWTQERLAEKADVSFSMISQIERGPKEGKYRYRAKIAEALGCTVSDLYQDADAGPHKAKNPSLKDAADVLAQLAKIEPKHRAFVLAVLFEDPAYMEGFPKFELPSSLSKLAKSG